jgi:integrase
MTKAANGRSCIHRRAGSTGWAGWVSFGTDPETGRRLRKKVNAATKTEVAAKVAKLEADRDGGYAGLAGRNTVAEWLDWWVATKVGSVRPKTIIGYGVDRAHIVRSIGSIELTKLTAEHIEQMYAEILATGVAGPATTTHVRATLSAALNAAARRGRIARNPVTAATSPRQVSARVEPLSEAETRRVLAAAAGGRNAARWYLALLVGPRQGEALGLRWEDVDLDAGTLRIRRSLARAPWKHGCGSVPCDGERGADCPQRHGGGLVTGPVKTAAGERTVALPAGLTGMLRAHRTAQTAERLRAGSAWRDTGHVFTDERGQPLDPRRDWGRWKELLASAGVRDARLHDARHSSATFALLDGVDPVVVMAWHGWGSRVMLDRYQHAVDTAQIAAAAKTDARFFGHG